MSSVNFDKLELVQNTLACVVTLTKKWATSSHHSRDCTGYGSVKKIRRVSKKLANFYVSCDYG